MFLNFRETLYDLWNLILNVDFWDVLDILIIAYIIYRILAALRRTSSMSVVKGIILILAVVWVSNLLELDVINYLLGQAMQMGVVIVIVLFHPEIRRSLEQMGSKRLSFLFKRPVKPDYLTECIASTVSASVAMSKTKTGALIIFERDVGLDDYIRTGTRIDAAISAELLENIFFHNTPLHDGAVIIQDGRIVAAGCMLPLSSNTNISRDLGMRHRAGIGISERSDAVAVAISEESGSISVAVGGMLKRHLAAETFEKLLLNELMPSGGQRERRGDKRKKVKP